MRYFALARFDHDDITATAPRACAVFLVLLLILATMMQPQAASAAPPEIVLGTTSSLQASGLLDALVPVFEQQTGYRVKIVAVSAAQALTLGMRGEVDLLLVNSPTEERQFVAGGHGLDRRLVLHDDFVLVGPRADPAAVQSASDLADALRRVAGAASWTSRADNSSPYQLEKRLWQQAGLDPQGQPWYVEVGQGIVGTLAAASERQAYTLAERRAMLERQRSLDLAILGGGYPDLLDPYSVIVVNPAKGPWLDEAGARAFGDFLLAPQTQGAIGQYDADRYGQPIFTPDAGQSEDALAPSR
jgi:tungstate transport system substrate-binding protein